MVSFFRGNVRSHTLPADAESGGERQAVMILSKSVRPLPFLAWAQPALNPGEASPFLVGTRLGVGSIGPHGD